jgi:membrane protease YdiL (CAAX protease family)
MPLGGRFPPKRANLSGCVVNTAGSEQPPSQQLSPPLPAESYAYTPETRWPPLAAIPAAFVIFVAASLIAVIPAEYYARHAGISLGDAKILGADDPRVQTLNLILLGASQLSIAFFVWLASGLFKSSRTATLALRRPEQGVRAFVEGLLIVLVATGLYSLIVFSLNPNLLLPDLRPFSKMMHSDAWWLTLLVVGVGAPLAEEFLFRGFLFSAISKTRLGLIGTAILTSAVWTSLHVGYAPAAVIEVFGIGLVLSWLLVRSGSLWVPIFCHAAYNTLLMVMLMFISLPAAA